MVSLTLGKIYHHSGWNRLLTWFERKKELMFTHQLANLTVLATEYTIRQSSIGRALSGKRVPLFGIDREQFVHVNLKHVYAELSSEIKQKLKILRKNEKINEKWFDASVSKVRTMELLRKKGISITDEAMNSEEEKQIVVEILQYLAHKYQGVIFTTNAFTSYWAEPATQHIIICDSLSQLPAKWQDIEKQYPIKELSTHEHVFIESKNKISFFADNTKIVIQQSA